MKIKGKHYLLWAAGLLVVCMTFVVYLPALQNGFLNYDDDVYVYDNPDIQSIDLKFLKWIFTPEANPTWHPLTLLSLAFDYSLWGLNPWGYHLTNVIFHALNTLLVFILAVRLTECSLYWKDRLHKKAFMAGAVTSLLFALHPLHVESIAWISERKDVLSAFFFLSSILAYLKYTSSNSKSCYGLCLILFVLALTSKPMAVSLPFVLIILDRYPLRRLNKGAIVEKVPFFLFGLLTSIMTLWAQHMGGALKPLETHPLMGRVLVGVRALILYLLKMLFPFNLAPYYPYPQKIGFFTVEYAGSFILLIAISMVALLSFKKRHLLAAAWFYYVVMLIPVIGLIKVGGYSMADRYTYLPSLGPFILIGLGVASIFERYKKWLRYLSIAILSIIFGIMVAKTLKQIALWHDSITLWSYEIKLYPDVYRSYYHRGAAYGDMGSHRLALKDLNKVIELNFAFAEAYYARGNSYHNLGEYREALRDFSIAIELGVEKLYRAYTNRGIVYYELGDYRQAAMNFNKAIELSPGDPYAYYYLRKIEENKK